jgi:hypothetical protein
LTWLGAPEGLDRDQTTQRKSSLCLKSLTESSVRQFAQLRAPGQPWKSMQESATENAGLRHQERQTPRRLGSARHKAGG